VAGLQALPEFDLSFDLCNFHPQLANTVKLVQQCPHVSFVLDHIGKPGIADGLLDPWREATATEYPMWVWTLDQALSGCSEGELRRLYRDNAIEFYRL
jgi:predicted TIM-barrel fold metal-dependent hydrolase